MNHIASLVSPEDDLLLQVQGMVAEYERAKILERSRRGKRHAAQTGEVSAGAPIARPAQWQPASPPAHQHNRYGAGGVDQCAGTGLGEHGAV